MPSFSNAEFVDIKTVILKRISGTIPFDIYIKRAENAFSKMFMHSEALDRERMEAYEKEKGVTSFYVKREDYRQYLLYVEQIATKAFANSAQESKEDLVLLIKEMTDLTMVELVVNKVVDEMAVSYAATTMKGCIDLLAYDPKSFFQILKLFSNHPYMIKHAVMTTVFALVLAKQSGVASDKTLSSLGQGCFLHDIGMSMIPVDIEAKEELSPEEWKQVKQHPELGKRLLDPIRGLAPEVREIVLQHHEQPNGNGYPNSLRANQIIHLAKIVAIADSFVALLSSRPFRTDALPPIKALEIMQEDRGKFDPKLLETFIKIFVKTK